MSHTSDRGIDYEIEQFWLQFKCSIINFYEKNNNLLTRPINKWSNHLNILQSKNSQMIKNKLCSLDKKS